MIELKLHWNGEDCWIEPTDYLQGKNEDEPAVRKMLRFLFLLADELNYFVLGNTETAYGAPTFENIQGKVDGYMIAKSWARVDTATHVAIYSGKRKIIQAEKPHVPQKKI